LIFVPRWNPIPSGAQPGTWKLRYSFDGYTIDPDRRELRRGASPIAVEPQVFDLLDYLIRNRERVVSRDDLIESVWGGRIVSESALSTRINAARSAIGDSGAEQRLIKTHPRKGIRFTGTVEEERQTATQQRGVLELPDKPSIAVLPFQNMSDDPEQGYFADGMVEEIITSLSRMSWLFVIARNSTFTYKGRAVDVKQVGRELGVRYVLEGSVRKAADRVRITGQLIDAATDGHLWAEHFDGTLENIFDLQDHVAASVVGAIAPKLEQAEIERAKRKPTDRLDAYDFYLRGIAKLHEGNRAANDEALHLFNRAIELDHQYASACGMAAYCYAWRRANGWMSEPARELAEAAQLARRAVELGRDDAIALCWGGFALARVLGDLDQGAGFIDQALVLNPNFATAWGFSGRVRVYRGETDLAIEHLARAMRLSPRDPEIYGFQGSTAYAHFFAGRLQEATTWAETAIRENANFLPVTAIAATSYALTGQIEKAKVAMERLRQINPKLRLSTLKDEFAFRRGEDMARLTEGLRIAGLPD
jgi:TolB-like protein/tetratricopeptide (TPR) repeat protein